MFLVVLWWSIHWTVQNRKGTLGKVRSQAIDALTSVCNVWYTWVKKQCYAHFVFFLNLSEKADSEVICLSDDEVGDSDVVITGKYMYCNNLKLHWLYYK